MRVILFIILSLISLISNGQGFVLDTLSGAYYMEGLNPNQIEILQVRRQTIQYLKHNQIDSIQLNSSEVYAYSIVEDEWLMLIRRDYDGLCNAILKNEKYTYQHKRNINRRFPYRSMFQPDPRVSIMGDSLNKIIWNYLRDNRLSIQSNIQSSNISPERKDFLSCYLLFYILNMDFFQSDVEAELITKSRNFLKDYPNSLYTPLVSKYFNNEFKKSNWGMGSYLQTGVMIPTGNLANHLNSNPLLTLGITINYSKIYLYFAFINGGFKTPIRKDFEYEKTWRKNDSYTYTTSELLLGYNIINKKRFGVTPFIGLMRVRMEGFSDIDTTYYEDVSVIKSSNVLTFGIHIDHRWAHSRFKGQRYFERGVGKAYGYGVTKLTIGYHQPNYKGVLPDFSGSYWYIRIGIGNNWHFKKKVKNYDN